jgi:hypothetical protein
VSERRSIEGCLELLARLGARIAEDPWPSLRGEAARRAIAARAPGAVVLEGALHRTGAADRASGAGAADRASGAGAADRASGAGVGFALDGVDLLGLPAGFECFEGLRHRVEGWLRPADTAGVELEVFAIEAMRISRTTRFAGRAARSYRSAMPSEQAGETLAWTDALHGSFGEREAAAFVSAAGRDAEQALAEVRALWLRHLGIDRAEAPFLLWDDAPPPEAFPREVDRRDINRDPAALLEAIERRMAEAVASVPGRSGAPIDGCVLLLDPAAPRLRMISLGAHRALMVRGGRVEIVAQERAPAIERDFPPDAALFIVARPGGFDDPAALDDAARLADPEAMALRLAELSMRLDRSPWALFWLGPKTPETEPKRAPSPSISNTKSVSAKRDAFVREGALPKGAGHLSIKKAHALKRSVWGTIDARYALAGHFEAPRFEGIHVDALRGALPLEDDRRYRVEGWVVPDESFMPNWVYPRSIEALHTAPARAFGELRVCAFRGGEGASAPSSYARVDALAFPDEGGLTLASVVTGPGELFAQERCRAALRPLRADRATPSLFLLGDDVDSPLDPPLGADPSSPEARDPDAIAARAHRRALAALAPSWPDALAALRFAAGRVAFSLGPNTRAWRLSGGADVHEIQETSAPLEAGDALLVTSGESEWPPREAVLRHGLQAFVDAMRRLAHPWGLLLVERGATSDARLTTLQRASEEASASPRENPSMSHLPGPRRRAHAGLRFQSALEAADRGLRHADFVSARPGGFMVVGLFRGVAPYSGDIAADICRWVLSTLLDEPSYGAPLAPFAEEPPREHGIRNNLSRWVAHALDRSPLPSEPGPLVEALAARISAVFTRLNGADEGLQAHAFGVLACVSSARAWIIRRGIGRVVRVRGRGASIIVPEHTLAQQAEAAGAPVEGFMHNISISAFDDNLEAQPVVELALDQGDRLVFASSDGFELTEPSFFSEDDGAPSLCRVRDAIVAAKPDGWGFVAVDIGFEGR